MAYQINDKAKDFLQKNPKLFSTKKKAKAEAQTDTSIIYAHIEKNDTKYGNKLMYLEYAQVGQIKETDIGNGTYLTELNIGDDNEHQYYIFYIGELTEILEGDAVEVYGLPLGMSHFDNVEGGQTLCPILAGSYVKKL